MMSRFAQLFKQNNSDEPGLSPITRNMKISCLAVFIISLAILWWNAAPSVTFHDSSEFAIAAASAGIPHPPGAPTYTALNSLWVRLGAFADPARGTNLFSGLMGAITLALLCLLVQMWTTIIYPKVSKVVSLSSALAAVAIMLHSTAFLEQSFITEQYTLLTVLITSMLLVSTFIVINRQSDAGIRTNDRRLLITLGLLWGLAIGNHLSQVSLLFLVVWVVLAGTRKEDRLRGFGYTFVGLAVGLLVFLWVPIRSYANPLIDWGNVKSLPQFIWAIQRKAWHTRALGSAPPDFITEWIRSYAIVAQVGGIALGLAGVGVLLAARRRVVLAGMLVMASVPYALGMIYGHLKQVGMDVSYIKSYGVSDWHLPEYLVIAVLAGLGLAAVAEFLRHHNFRIAVNTLPPFVAVLLIGMSAFSISTASLRNNMAPQTYLDALTQRLPKSAIILPSEDNAFGALTYWSYISHPDPERWVILRTASLAKSINNALKRGQSWEQVEKYKYLTKDNMNPIKQPFRIEVPSHQQALSRPVYADFNPGFPDESKYLLPDGMLFRVTGRPTSDAEVLSAEALWTQENPELLRSPSDKSDRMERHAWAVLHRERGAFFTERRLWKLSADCYTRALEWVPDDGQIWYCLAYALDQEGQLKGAIIAYKQAIALVPHMQGVRQNLAIIHMQTNEIDEAIRLLKEEIQLYPKNETARILLDKLTNQAKTKAMNR